MIHVISAERQLLIKVADIARAKGDFAQALTHLRNALELTRTPEERKALEAKEQEILKEAIPQARARRNEAERALKTGNVHEAARLIEEAILISDPNNIVGVDVRTVADQIVKALRDRAVQTMTSRDLMGYELALSDVQTARRLASPERSASLRLENMERDLNRRIAEIKAEPQAKDVEVSRQPVKLSAEEQEKILKDLAPTADAIKKKYGWELKTDEQIISDLLSQILVGEVNSEFKSELLKDFETTGVLARTANFFGEISAQSRDVRIRAAQVQKEAKKLDFRTLMGAIRRGMGIAINEKIQITPTEAKQELSRRFATGELERELTVEVERENNSPVELMITMMRTVDELAAELNDASWVDAIFRGDTSDVAVALRNDTQVPRARMDAIRARLDVIRDASLESSARLDAARAAQKQAIDVLEEGESKVRAGYERARDEADFYHLQAFHDPSTRNLAERKQALAEERTALEALKDFIRGEREKSGKEIIVPGLETVEEDLHMKEREITASILDARILLGQVREGSIELTIDKTIEERTKDGVRTKVESKTEVISKTEAEKNLRESKEREVIGVKPGSELSDFTHEVIRDADRTGILGRVVDQLDPLAPRSAETVLALLERGQLSRDYFNILLSEISRSVIYKYFNTTLNQLDSKFKKHLLEALSRLMKSRVIGVESNSDIGKRISELITEKDLEAIPPETREAILKAIGDFVFNAQFQTMLAIYLAGHENLKKIERQVEDKRERKADQKDLKKGEVRVVTSFGTMVVDSYVIDLLRSVSGRTKSYQELVRQFVGQGKSEEVFRDIVLVLERFEQLSKEQKKDNEEFEKMIDQSSAQAKELGRQIEKRKEEIEKLEKQKSEFKSKMADEFKIAQELALQIMKVVNKKGDGLFAGAQFKEMLHIWLAGENGVFTLIHRFLNVQERLGEYKLDEKPEFVAIKSELAKLEKEQANDQDVLNALWTPNVNMATLVDLKRERKQIEKRRAERKGEILKLEGRIEEEKLWLLTNVKTGEAVLVFGEKVERKELLKDRGAFIEQQSKRLVDEEAARLMNVFRPVLDGSLKTSKRNAKKAAESLFGGSSRLSDSLAQVIEEAGTSSDTSDLARFLDHHSEDIQGHENGRSEAKVELTAILLERVSDAIKQGGLTKEQVNEDELARMAGRMLTLCSPCVRNVIADAIDSSKGDISSILRLGRSVRRLENLGIKMPERVRVEDRQTQKELEDSSLYAARAFAVLSDERSEALALFQAHTKGGGFEKMVTDYFVRRLIKDEDLALGESETGKLIGDVVNISKTIERFEIDKQKNETEIYDEFAARVDLKTLNAGIKAGQLILDDMRAAIQKNDFKKVMQIWESLFKADSVPEGIARQAFFDLVRAMIAKEFPALYMKLFGFSGETYFLLNPRSLLSGTEIKQNWDVALIAFVMYESTKEKLWFKKDQRETFIEMRDGQIANASMGSGKTFVGLMLAAIHGVNMILVPSENHVRDMLKDSKDYKSFFEALSGGKVIENGTKLVNDIMSGKPEVSEKALDDLIRALEDKEHFLVLTDRHSMGAIDNYLRDTRNEKYEKFHKAFKDSYRLFDEVHQTANPMYFIVGGKTQAARDALANFEVLDTLAQVAGKILVYDKKDYHEGLVLVTDNEATFQEYYSDEKAALLFINGKLRMWTGKPVMDVFKNNPDVKDAIEKLKSSKDNPFYAQELASILKARAIDFSDLAMVDKYLLSSGGVKLVDGQYRPINAEGNVEKNLIIEDTPWLIGIAHTMKDAWQEAKTRVERGETQYKRILMIIEKNSLIKDKENSKEYTGKIEITSTVTAVSMFDLFLSSSNDIRPLGMSGTALGVQTALHVLMARYTHAVEVEKETMAFMVELLTNRHKVNGENSNTFGIHALDSSKKTPEQVAEEHASIIMDAVKGTRESKFAKENPDLIRFSEGAPAIVGKRSNFDISLLASILEKQGIKVLVIDGMTEKVDEVVDDFNARYKRGERNLVFLTNQRGLTGFDYQAKANFLLFDAGLSEMQAMQSIGRVGRTISDKELAGKKNVGQRYDSHAVVFLDQQFVEQQFGEFQGENNKQRFEKWQDYFREKLSRPETRRGLEFWVKREGETIEYRATDPKRESGWEKRTVVTILEDVRDPDKKGKISAEEQMILSIAINTAKANSETAKSLLEQLWTFRMIIDPVKQAFSQALKNNNQEEIDLIHDFGQELHRHWKGDVGLEPTDIFYDGKAYVRGVTFERVETATKKMEAFLRDKDAKLSESVKSILKDAVDLAQKVKDQLKYYETIKPENPEFARVFQGNLSNNLTTKARSLIAISKRFAVEILPTETSNTPDKSAAERFQEYAEIHVGKDRVEKMLGKTSETGERVNQVIKDNLKEGANASMEIKRDDETGEMYAMFYGERVDLSMLTDRERTLIFAFPSVKINLTAAGTITITPDLETLINQKADGLKNENLPDLFKSLFGEAGVAELMIALKVQSLFDKLELTESDRSALRALAANKEKWDEFRKKFEEQRSQEERFKLLMSDVPGFSKDSREVASRLAKQSIQNSGLLDQIDRYMNVHKRVVEMLKAAGNQVSQIKGFENADLSDVDLTNLNLIHLWTGLRVMMYGEHYQRLLLEYKKINESVEKEIKNRMFFDLTKEGEIKGFVKDFANVVATTVVASSGVTASAQKWAYKVLHINNTEPIQGLEGEWKNVPQIAATVALGTGAYEDIAKQVEDVRAIVVREKNESDRQFALSDIIRLRIQKDLSVNDVSNVIDLYRALNRPRSATDASPLLAARTLEDAYLIFSLHLTKNYVGAIQTYLASLSAAGFIVTTASEFAEVTQTLGIEFQLAKNGQLVFTYPVAKDELQNKARAKFLELKDHELQVKGLSGKTRLVIKDASAEMAASAEFGFRNGVWTILGLKDSTQNINHDIRMTENSLEYQIWKGGRVFQKARLVGQNKVIFDDMIVKGDAARVEWIEPEAPLRVSVTTKERMTIVDFGTELNFIKSGMLQAVYNEAGHLSSFIHRNILGTENLDAATTLYAGFIQDENGEWQRNIYGKAVEYPNEDKKLRNVTLPPNVRLDVNQNGSVKVLVEDLAGNPQGDLLVDPSTGEVASVLMVDLNRLIDLTQFEDDKAGVSDVKRWETWLMRTTAFKQFIASQIYLALSAKDLRERFVAWFQAHASLISEPVLLSAIEHEFLEGEGVRDENVNSALRILKQFFKDEKEARELLLLNKLFNKSDPTFAIAHKAFESAQFDSEETDELLNAFFDLVKEGGIEGFDPNSLDEILQDSPYALIQGLISKEKDEKLKEAFKKWQTEVASAEESVTLDQLINFMSESKFHPEHQLDHTKEIEILRKLKVIINEFQKEETWKKVIDRIVAKHKKEKRELEGVEMTDEEENSLRFQVQENLRYLASKANTWDLFQYVRMERHSKNNEIVMALERGNYDEAAALIAEELTKISDASRGLSESRKEAFVEKLAKFLKDGKEGNSRDYVMFQFTGGANVANLRVVKRRIEELAWGGWKNLKESLRNKRIVRRIKQLIDEGKLENDAIRIAANEEWRKENGYRNHAVPSLIFYGDSARHLGEYWSFVGDGWDKRSGAETFIQRSFTPKGDLNIFSKTGLIVIDSTWVDQSYFHEELHLIHPKPRLLYPDGDPKIEEVMNFFAQTISRSLDLESGRGYDIQLLYGKMEHYARQYHFDMKVMKKALDGVLYITQYLPMSFVQNVIRNSSGPEDLLWWHFKSPEDLLALKGEQEKASRAEQESGVRASTYAQSDSFQKEEGEERENRERKGIAEAQAERVRQAFAESPEKGKELAMQIMRTSYRMMKRGEIDKGEWQEYTQHFIDLLVLHAKTDAELDIVRNFPEELRKFIRVELPRRPGRKITVAELEKDAKELGDLQDLKAFAATYFEYKELEEFAARAWQAFLWMGSERLDKDGDSLVAKYVEKYFAIKSEGGTSEIPFGEVMKDPKRLNREDLKLVAKLKQGPTSLTDELRHAELDFEIGISMAEPTEKNPNPDTYVAIGMRFSGTETVKKEHLKIADHNHPPQKVKGKDGKVKLEVTVIPSLMDLNADGLLQALLLRIKTVLGVTKYRKLTAEERDPSFTSGTRIRVVGEKEWKIIENWWEVNDEVQRLSEGGKRVEFEFIHPTRLDIAAHVEFLPWAWVLGQVDQADEDARHQAMESLRQEGFFANIDTHLTEDDLTSLRNIVKDKKVGEKTEQQAVNEETLQNAQRDIMEAQAALGQTKQELEAHYEKYRMTMVELGERFRKLANFRQAQGAQASPDSEKMEKETDEISRQLLEEFRLLERELRGAFVKLSGPENLKAGDAVTIYLKPYLVDSVSKTGKLKLVSAKGETHEGYFWDLVHDLGPMEHFEEPLAQAEVNLTAKMEAFNQLISGYMRQRMMGGNAQPATPAQPELAFPELPFEKTEGAPTETTPTEAAPRAELRRTSVEPERKDASILELLENLGVQNGRRDLIYDLLGELRGKIREAVKNSPEFANLYFDESALSTKYLKGGIRIAKQGELNGSGAWDLDLQQIILNPDLLNRAKANEQGAREKLMAVIAHELTHAVDYASSEVRKFEEQNPILGVYRAELRAHAVMTIALGMDQFDSLVEKTNRELTDQLADAIAKKPELSTNPKVQEQMSELRDLINLTKVGQPLGAVIFVGQGQRGLSEKLVIKQHPNLIRSVEVDSAQAALHEFDLLKEQGFDEIVIVRGPDIAELAKEHQAVNIVRSERRYDYLLKALILTAIFLGAHGFKNVFGLSSVELNASFAALVENKFRESQLLVHLQVAA